MRRGAARFGRTMINVPRGWGERCVVLLLTALVVLPIGAILVELLSPSWDVWARLSDTVLPAMLRNTALLVLGVGIGTLLLGTGLAWLVTAYRFPGRDLFDWALMLPLALPSYILAFVYIATFDFVGVVQSTLRDRFGADVWFPDIYTGWSAIAVLTATLYPYVYLLARAAFRSQSAYTFDVARTMGLGHGGAFVRLVLPLARPALVSGVSLAIMEALGDFATVRFFSYPTLSEGVFRIWEGMMNRAAAMEVAGLLGVFALVLMLLELGSRRGARYTQRGGRAPSVPAIALRGRRAWGACVACGLVSALTFVLPTLQLSIWAVQELVRQGPGGTLNVAFQRYTITTALLAGLAALVAVVWALLLARGARRIGPTLAGVSTRLATLGYAMPGAVVGFGALLAVTAIDATANRWGLASGLVLTGSIGGLTYAYVVRYLAVAYNSIDAGLAGVAPTLGDAARTLGAGPLRVLARVQAPLIGRSLCAAAVLVFVDVMKELPVTLLLRPFGMDTLAIWAYLLAVEGFWEAAAVPSLSILIVGLAPVIILVRLSGSPSAAHRRSPFRRIR